MSRKLCRLCLNSERLIYLFDNRLNSQQQLRKCILLCTGVDIQSDDLVSKHVCHNCCIIAVKLFKFRQNALASDMALKKYDGQNYNDVPPSKEDIMQFHNSILAGVTESKLKNILDDVNDIPIDDFSDSLNIDDDDNDDNMSVLSKSTKEDLPVHSTVRDLFKRFPKIVVPNDVLPYDIKPKIPVDKSVCHDLLTHSKTEDIVTTGGPASQAIDRLKQKCCPSLNIVRVQTTKNSADTEEFPKTHSVTDMENNKIWKPDQKRTSSTEPLDEKTDKSRRPSNTESLEENTLDKIVRNRRSFKTEFVDGTIPRKTNRKRQSSDTEPAVPIPPKRHQVFIKECIDDKGNVEIPPIILPSTSELFTSLMTTPKEKPVQINTETAKPGGSIVKHEERSIILCNFCGRMYDNLTQLSIHERRIHPRCLICRKPQKSSAALAVHIREVCFKYLEDHPPDIQLIRVDEIPRLIRTYKDSFDYYFSTIIPNGTKGEQFETSDDDDDVVIVDEFDYITEADCMAEEIPNERTSMLSVFKKYKGLDTHTKKLKFAQTDPLQINVRYDTQNRIIIENMYPDLKIYRVPLEMKISNKVSVDVSTSPTIKTEYSKCDWDSAKAIGLISKTTVDTGGKLPPQKSAPTYNYLITNKIGAPNIVISGTSPIDNMQLQNIYLLAVPTTASQLKNATSVTTSLPKYVIKPSASSSHTTNNHINETTNSDSNVFTSQDPVTSLLPKVTQNQIPSLSTASVKNINLRNILHGTSLLKNQTPSASAASPSVENVQSKQNSTLANILHTSGATGTSHSATPSSSEGRTLLRVKAPWEINQL